MTFDEALTRAQARWGRVTWTGRLPAGQRRVEWDRTGDVTVTLREVPARVTLEVSTMADGAMWTLAGDPMETAPAAGLEEALDAAEGWGL